MGSSRANLGKLFKINELVEAAGVELAQVLKTRKLLILRTDEKHKTDTSAIVACKMHTKMRDPPTRIPLISKKRSSRWY
jgi:hypothetical protein